MSASASAMIKHSDDDYNSCNDDFVSGSKDSDSDPYITMLPLHS